MEKDKEFPKSDFKDSVYPMGEIRGLIANVLHPKRYAADIDWILCEVLEVERSELATVRTVSTAQYETIMSYSAERAKGKPLAYIVGYRNFMGYDIAVEKGVLIPRFETEMLVEKALSGIDKSNKIHVLDLCTGSGAIAVALSKALPNAEVTASDISDAALGIARRNFDKNGVRVNPVRSDLLDGIAGKYDLIVCNPPYIRTADIADLDIEVKGFEPRQALDGGDDGLQFYRRLLTVCKYLNPGGAAYFECGDGQAGEVRDMFAATGYGVEVYEDLDGVERIVKVKHET